MGFLDEQGPSGKREGRNSTPDSAARPNCEMRSWFLAHAAAGTENGPRPASASGKEEHLRIDVWCPKQLCLGTPKVIGK